MVLLMDLEENKKVASFLFLFLFHITIEEVKMKKVSLLI